MVAVWHVCDLRNHVSCFLFVFLVSFSADFVNVLSRALQIPKWRLFNIRTENADVDKCQIVKFGIIGNGISPFVYSFYVTYHIFVFIYITYLPCDVTIFLAK